MNSTTSRATTLPTSLESGQHPEAVSLAAALQLARDTKKLEIGPGAVEAVPRIFRECFGTRPAMIVADENTFSAAGARVAAAFAATNHPLREPYVFKPRGLYAEHSFVTVLHSAIQKSDAIPVAVGSGTINDLTKLAAHQASRQYLCVATAASMDGYTAYGASITKDGSKQTFFCPAPAAVVADLNNIAAAPPHMNAWGYADLLAKVTAGADWLAADTLGVEPISPGPWAMVQGRLREQLDKPAGLLNRDLSATRRLVEGLMLSGFAMQAAQSSRPASGAEHQFSHLWDMQHHTHNGCAPSHGFKVAVGTLAMTALYEALLQMPLEKLDVDSICAKWPQESAWQQRIRELFDDPQLTSVALQETSAKHQDTSNLAQHLIQLRETWPVLRERLRQQLIPFAVLRQMLESAQAPTEPEHIGISRQRLKHSFWQAYFIRRRYTALDLAVRAGVLDACLDQIFGPNGAWPIQPLHN